MSIARTHALRALSGAFALSLPLVAQSDDVDAPWLSYDTAIYPQGIDSWASRAADFDGDGDLDLAVSSWYANPRLSILMNDGAGAFAPPVMHVLALGALDLEVGDFDVDGDIDIAVCNTGQFWEGNSVSLFRNLGTGSFAPGGNYAAGNGPTGITTADIDQDGFLDLAVAHDRYIEYGTTIAWMRNNGAGGFQSPQVITVGSGTHRIASGDLNGDGFPELVVARETNQLTVLPNTGGAFGPGVTLGAPPAGAFRTSPNATLADVDLDGDLDVLYSHTDLGFPGGFGLIALYRNAGDGTLAAAESIQLLAGQNGAADIAAEDVTGDGWPDLVGSCESSQLWVLVPNDGSGGFLPAIGYRAGEDPVSVQAVDLDGDGDRDVASLGRDSLSISVHLNPGAGDFPALPPIPMADPALAPTSYSDLAAADVDDDGDLDLAVGYSHNFEGLYGIALRLNQGDGSFVPAVNYATSSLAAKVRLADLSNDGRADLVWIDSGFPPLRFRYRVNQGNGQFGPIVSGPAINMVAHTMEALDVDTDGDLDVLLGAHATVYVARNNGGSFANYLQHAVTTTVSALAGGDFDGDGDLDLATNSGVQGYVEISLGNGNGTFQPPFFQQTGRGVRALDVGDVDADGTMDVAAAYGLDGNGLSILRGRGDGSFRPPLDYHGAYSSTHDNVESVVLGDLDLDGDLDAMSAYYGSQELLFWRGNGDGSFEEAVRYGVGQKGWDVAFGDFDGDGRPDVAVEVELVAANGWYSPGIVLLRGAGDAPPCANPQPYCTAAPNSAGAGALIGWSGAPSIGTNDFRLNVVAAPPVQPGLFYYGPAAIQQPFGNGFRCVGSGGVGVFRLGPPLQTDAAGAAERALDFTLPPASAGPGAIEAGSTWRFQYWYRDPAAGGANFNLSDGLSVGFCP